MKRNGIIEKKTAQRIANPTSPRLLPLKEASRVMGLTLWSVRERIWSGQLPVVQFPGGRKMFIDTRDIDIFIDRNKKVFD